ncbi:craniofacial development protein 1 [Chrysoperla carnea]|uniref:craniofacial development protein 1 n=1 Tax=Chrysoperla carnea TaxID=189513 RepID=UPI001D084E37|nr:craniofacial development protein 1 [Chrysoperla carnea]
MDKHELPSDSDASDEDYVPNGVEAELLSEEESDGVDDELTENVQGNKKRKSRTKKISKKPKIDENNAETEKAEADKKFVEMSEDEKRKHEENLWASFLGSDADKKDKNSSENKDSRPKSNGNSVPNEICKKPVPKPVTILEFAGEEIRVDETPHETVTNQPSDPRVSNASASTSSNNEISVPKTSLPKGRGKGGLGVSALLSQIGKKTKISTLEKSKLDWDRFKNKEGLNEEITNHNKGKDGYLERQDFLQRTDLRQFEIEKQLRTVTRRSNK